MMSRWNPWNPLVMSYIFVPSRVLARNVPTRESNRRLSGLSAIDPPLQKREPKAHSLPSLSTRRNIGTARGSCDIPPSISMMSSWPAS